MARRATFIDSLRHWGTEFLLIDGGSFSHKSKNNMPETVATWREMDRLGYDAITLGVEEIGYWQETDSLRASLDLPIVCTNLEQRQGDRWVPIGEPYRIVEHKGINVGILSVTNEIIMSETVLQKAGGQVRLLPPEETTHRVSRELAETCDLVVLLAHVDPTTMERYAQEFEHVDVVLGGRNAPKDEGPQRYGHAIVNRSGTRGQYVANTRLILSPGNEIVDYGGLNISLSTDIPEDPAVLAEVAKAEAEMEKLRKQRPRPALPRNRELPVAPGVHRQPLPRDRDKESE